jgi:ribulose kinase
VGSTAFWQTGYRLAQTKCPRLGSTSRRPQSSGFPSLPLWPQTRLMTFSRDVGVGRDREGSPSRQTMYPFIAPGRLRHFWQRLDCATATMLRRATSIDSALRLDTPNILGFKIVAGMMMIKMASCRSQLPRRPLSTPHRIRWLHFFPRPSCICTGTGVSGGLRSRCRMRVCSHFHVGRRVWADDVIERLGLPRSIFPKVHASADVVGPLTQEAATELGLPHGIPVSAGCADQPAQAVGNGLIDPPMGSITIGTGGQVFVPLTQPLVDPGLRIQTFCHAPQTKWYLLGAMLSAGMALRWLRAVLGREKVSYEELVQLASEVEPGSVGLFFLPYLVGERSPLMDPKAKAGFIGLALRHGPGHFVRALLEGVAFALRQIVDTMVGCGADLTRLVASGNGLANPIWRHIVADILNRPLCQGTGEQASERAGVGAAMIAGIGSGIFDGYQDTQKLAPIFNVVTEPNRNMAALYESHYRSFQEIYPRLKSWRAI